MNPFDYVNDINYKKDNEVGTGWCTNLFRDFEGDVITLYLTASDGITTLETSIKIKIKGELRCPNEDFEFNCEDECDCGKDKAKIYTENTSIAYCRVKSLLV